MRELPDCGKKFVRNSLKDEELLSECLRDCEESLLEISILYYNGEVCVPHILVPMSD